MSAASPSGSGLGPSPPPRSSAPPPVGPAEVEPVEVGRAPTRAALPLPGPAQGALDAGATVGGGAYFDPAAWVTDPAAVPEVHPDGEPVSIYVAYQAFGTDIDPDDL